MEKSDYGGLVISIFRPVLIFVRLEVDNDILVCFISTDIQ